MKFCSWDTAGSQGARWLHLACSGSQSQHAIWFILPARITGHTIQCCCWRLKMELYIIEIPWSSANLDLFFVLFPGDLTWLKLFSTKCPCWSLDPTNAFNGSRTGVSIASSIMISNRRRRWGSRDWKFSDKPSFHRFSTRLKMNGWDTNCKTKLCIISTNNWTEWSTLQGVIARVISKSDEREARGRFEITSTITPTRGPITN